MLIFPENCDVDRTLNALPMYTAWKAESRWTDPARNAPQTERVLPTRTKARRLRELPDASMSIRLAVHPMRVNERTENEDPTWHSCTRESEEAPRTRPATLMLDPSRPSARRDNEEPQKLKQYTDMVRPHRIAPRHENVDPRLVLSTSEILRRFPNRPAPYTVQLLPSLMKERMLMLLPMVA
jgi:hypothetical protein